MSANETRPCIYNDQRAIFHRWCVEQYVIEPSIMVGGGNGGQVSYTLALIELCSGEVLRVSPEKIRFADGGNGMFERVYFDKKKD